MYCTECGKKLIEVDGKYFDSKTGKRNKRDVCPTRLCGHTGWDHDYEQMKGFWNDIVGRHKCSRCGRTYLSEF